MIDLCNDWGDILAAEFELPYYKKLHGFLAQEYKSRMIFPDVHDIFRALKSTSYNDTRVVILGQDPYHESGQAHGLSFSVARGTAIPPSLMNIYKELQSDLGCTIPCHGCLDSWTKQGILLLNTILTVREGAANSHKNIGWEIFTDKIISLLNLRAEPIVFMLWGANARAKAALITNENHLVLQCPHPSPLSSYRGFFGCKHFSGANEFLKQHGELEIDWDICE